jgi:hypothetical protein
MAELSEAKPKYMAMMMGTMMVNSTATIPF